MAVQFQYFNWCPRSSLFAYLLIVLAVYLILLAVLHLPETIAKEFALIVGFNQMESYTAEQYCAVCWSSPSSRCPNCGAVAYCSVKCQRAHWEQLHNKECPLMAELKGCSMAHLATYTNIIEQCKPCEDAEKSTHYKGDPESGRCKLSPQTKSAFKQEVCVVVNSNSLSKSRQTSHSDYLSSGDSSDSDDAMSSLHGLD